MLPSRGDESGTFGDPALLRAPAGRGRGPNVRSLVVLAISALALIATSPGAPRLTGRAIGEVVIGGGEVIERELRVHVDPAGGNAASGAISLDFQAGSGLQTGYTRDVTLSLVGASDASGSFQPSQTFPIERCRTGCDLVYRIRIAAGSGVLPGSIVRYVVEVELQYDYSDYEPRDPTLLRLELEGAASGPVAPIWAIVAGIVALVGGILAGPVVHRRLAPNVQRAPSFALVALAVALIVWNSIDGLLSLVRLGSLGLLTQQPLSVFLIADPWSVILLGVLGWGVWRGLRRWPIDGGWLLGLGAVAMAGLGGLWLAWRLTLDVAVQPLVVAGLMAILGGLGGIVTGQAWRTDRRADHDRWWAAFAVLSHGILISGFGFLAEQSLYDPRARGDPVSLLALIPAALLLIAFHGWMGGRRLWLPLFDIVIAGVGLLGLWVWNSLTLGFSQAPARLEIDDVAVYLAVGAALVATVTSFHAMPQTGGPVTQSVTAADQPTT
jgi:hypothetical protein